MSDEKDDEKKYYWFVAFESFIKGPFGKTDTWKGCSVVETEVDWFQIKTILNHLKIENNLDELVISFWKRITKEQYDEFNEPS